MTQNQCPDCGAAFEPLDGPTHKYMGGSPECWAAFNEILAREFQDPAYGAAHRLTVDTYAVQHPGSRDRRAVQSVNIHLTALHLLLEGNRSEEYVRAALKKLASNYKANFEWLTPPRNYEITVKDVTTARTAEEHNAMVRKWAESVWRAWSPNHHIARDYALLIAD